MRTVHDVPQQNQALDSPGFTGEPKLKPKVGVEVVRSADLPRQFFRGRRPASHVLPVDGDVWERGLARAVRRPGVPR